MTRLCVTLLCVLALVCTGSVHATGMPKTQHLTLPAGGVPVTAVVEGVAVECLLWPFKNSVVVVMECTPVPSKTPKARAAKPKKSGGLSA